MFFITFFRYNKSSLFAPSLFIFPTSTQYRERPALSKPWKVINDKIVFPVLSRWALLQNALLPRFITFLSLIMQTDHQTAENSPKRKTRFEKNRAPTTHKERAFIIRSGGRLITFIVGYFSPLEPRYATFYWFAYRETTPTCRMGRFCGGPVLYTLFHRCWGSRRRRRWLVFV